MKKLTINRETLCTLADQFTAQVNAAGTGGTATGVSICIVCHITPTIVCPIRTPACPVYTPACPSHSLPTTTFPTSEPTSGGSYIG